MISDTTLPSIEKLCVRDIVTTVMADKTLQAPPVGDGGQSAASADNTGPQHAQVVAQHYNQLQEGGLDERTKSRIFYVRNFNNWIKSMAIGDALGLLRKDRGSGGSTNVSVLDLCAGKGGDLLKWKKGRIDRIVCADIAGTSVEQCASRYQDMLDRTKKERFQQKLFKAQFITADCTKERLRDQYEDPHSKFDLVSCQFSFHYCFESCEQADMMMRNACECLRVGGYFIGSTVNAMELVRRLRASDSMSFGNEIYRVTFQTPDKEQLPLFGAQYDFHLEGVVDCPEFLTYFPVVEKLAERYGMKLVYKKPFAEFFKEQVQENEGRGLIGRMQALEPYPADKDVDLMSPNPSDYSVAERLLDHLQQQQDSERNLNPDMKAKPSKVGTLSLPEWEATSIYMVFAFQKVSATTPAYESTSRPTTPVGSGSRPTTPVAATSPPTMSGEGKKSRPTTPVEGKSSRPTTPVEGKNLRPTTPVEGKNSRPTTPTESRSRSTTPTAKTSAKRSADSDRDQPTKHAKHS